jgi:hypothetical protein
MKFKNKIATLCAVAGLIVIPVCNLYALADTPTSADLVQTVYNAARGQKTKQYFYHDIDADIMIRDAILLNPYQLDMRMAQDGIRSLDPDDINYTYSNNSRTATIVTIDIKNKDKDAVLIKNNDFYLRDKQGNQYQAKSPDRQGVYKVPTQKGYNYALDLYFDVPDDSIIKDLIIKNPKIGNTDILPYNFDKTSFDALQKDKIYLQQACITGVELIGYFIVIGSVLIILKKAKRKVSGGKNV